MGFSSGMEQFTKVPSGAIDGRSPTIVKKDTCTCFTETGADGSEVFAWTGADCSLRVCPHGTAFGVHRRHDLSVGLLDNDHTAMEECSGVGTCDQKTGKCQCYDGYSGDACQRTVCPNDCSGAGRCKTQKQIVVDVANADSSFYIDTSSHAYTAFDAEKSLGCVCDQNRAGPDCSIKLCPSTADPMGGHGASMGRECSGRGLCVAGSCNCFAGYFGTKCQSQRANVQ